MKKVTLNVPNYSPDTGVALNWEGNFTIKVSDINGSVSIEANTEGLVSLANHLLNLGSSEIWSDAIISFMPLVSKEDL